MMWTETLGSDFIKINLQDRNVEKNCNLTVLKSSVSIL